MLHMFALCYITVISHLVLYANAVFPSQPCSTNSNNCHFYGDCCDSYSQRSTLLRCLLSERNNVITKILFNGNVSFSKGVYSVASCQNQDHKLVKKCENVKWNFDGRNSIPGFSAEGVLYSNAYCAECNGEKIVKRVSVTLKCDSEIIGNVSKSDIIDKLESEKSLPSGCHVHFNLRTDGLHVCYKNIQEKCLWGEMITQSDSSQYIVAANKSLSNEEFQTIDKTCAQGPTSYFSVANSSCTLRHPACLGCFYMSSKCFAYSGLVSSEEFIDSGFYRIFNIYDDDDDVIGTNSTNNSTIFITDLERGLSWVSKGFYYLSLLSLSLLVLVYCGFSALRNRAGLLVCSHAVSLLLVQTFLIYSQPRFFPLSLCVCYGLVMQFLICATFSWAAVFGADLLVTLSSKMLQHGQTKRIWPLMLAGWCPPIILTLLLALLHFLPATGPLLTAQSDCWYPNHKNKEYMISLFFVPLALCLCFNLIVISLLFHRLREAFNNAQNVSSRSYAQRLFVMTCKVSVILGAVWVPFFIVVVTTTNRSAVLAVEILVNLHGFFLFLAFGLSRRVRKQFRDSSSILTSTTLRRFSLFAPKTPTPAESQLMKPLVLPNVDILNDKIKEHET